MLNRELLHFTWSRQRYEYEQDYGKSSGIPKNLHRSVMTGKFMVPMGSLKEECFNYLCNVKPAFYNELDQTIHLDDETVRCLYEFESMIGGDLD